MTGDNDKISVPRQAVSTLPLNMADFPSGKLVSTSSGDRLKRNVAGNSSDGLDSYVSDNAKEQDCEDEHTVWGENV
jgi:hypothetical protein